MFCPRCGSLLKPSREKKGASMCSCGYSGAASGAIRESVKQAPELHIVEETETKPVTDAYCEKCGNKHAYFWSLQTRASDEPETRFFKCTKCKHTWREYK